MTLTQDQGPLPAYQSTGSDDFEEPVFRTLQVHYCGVCGAAMEKGCPMDVLEEHLAKHAKQLAAINHWAAVISVAASTTGVEADDIDLAEWDKLIDETQLRRDSQEDIDRKTEGVTWLSRLLGIANIIPNGSVLTGVSGGDSDWLDVTLNVSKVMYSVKNLRVRDIDAVKKKRNEMEHKYKVVILAEKETKTALEKDEKGMVTVMSQAEDREDDAMQCIEMLKKVLSRRHITLLTKEGTPDEKVTLQMIEARLSKVLHPVSTDLNITGTPILRLRGQGKPCKDNTLLVPIPGKSLELLDAHGIPHEPYQNGDITFPTREDTMNALDILESHFLPVKLYHPKCLDLNISITARPRIGPRSSRLVGYILKAAGEPAFVAACLIKRWARQHGVCGTRYGFISGFSLAIMFCYYLQQEGVAGYINHEEVPEIASDVLPTPKELPEGGNREVVRLVLGFFRFFSNFDWANRAVTLSKPPDVPVTPGDLGFTVDMTVATLPKHVKDQVHNVLVVHEPFENSNTAKRITVSKQYYVKGIIAMTHRLLSSKEGDYREKLNLLFNGSMGPETEIPWKLLNMRAPSSPCVDNKSMFIPCLPDQREEEEIGPVVTAMPNPTGEGAPVSVIRSVGHKKHGYQRYFPPPPPRPAVFPPAVIPRPYPVMTAHHLMFSKQHHYTQKRVCFSMQQYAATPPLSSSYTPSSSDSDRNGAG
eukprot:TRINITY_DN26479_c0_g1_i1.p1 TRINITY_DN26479_c0_g1~~TRINITY_DN26479_c0_g1_i1.p1  ORF type:complete len:703 (+),score=70.63 TRINITY_DN26479_c0_g1_i1:141-2249(+)